MAYYAASSPPPPKAPSLAPTTATDFSQVHAPPPQQEEVKKKKKNLAKRVLKELAGGGGNNNGVKVKGVPTVRPYGRGGVGIKPALSSKASLTSNSSRSPPSSLHQSQSSAPAQAQSPPPEPLRGPPDDGEYEYFDYDDNQSTISRIPAPRRTRQWIQQHAGQEPPSPPNSGSGPGPSVYSSNPRDFYPHSPPSSHYGASQYSRGSDPTQDPYYQQQQQQQQYPNGYAPTQGRRLQNVDEDALATEFSDQFGRMDMSSPGSFQQSRSGYAQSSTASMPTRRANTAPLPTQSANSMRSTPASQYAAQYANVPTPDSYYDQSGRHGQQSPYQQPQVARGDYIDAGNLRQQQSPPPGPPPPADSVTAQIVERYLAQHGIPAPQGLLDQHSRTQQHTQLAQTRELQSQIDSLREAERKARERLEALRKEGPTGGKKDDALSRLEIMSSGASEVNSGLSSGRRPISEVPSSVDTSASAAAIRSAIVVGSRQADGPTRPLTAQDRAYLEKEKLRRRDLEREERERVHDASSSSAAYNQQNQLAAMLAAQQQQQQQQQQQMYPQHMLPQGYGSQHMASPPVSPPPPPQMGYSQPGFGADSQQQLIMQLGALLLQQQQQLQMLAAGRAVGNPDGATPTPPAVPGFDLSALLSLGAALPNAQANMSALLQQQQLQQQSSYMTLPPMLTTTAPSISGYGGSQSPSSSMDPPSPATASSTSIIHATQSSGTSVGNGSSRFSPNPTPSPQPSLKQREMMAGANTLTATAPLRLDGLRGVGASFMSSFNRELGLGSDEEASPAREHRERSVPPQRASPPSVPLPGLPGSGPIPMSRSPEGIRPSGFNSSTPPPAYMSSTR